MLIGVDVGGTFTDIVFVHPGRKTVESFKVASTSNRLEEAVMTGIRRLVGRTGAVLDRADRLVHGTTVATNALLQGKWARTALVTTAGFRDVIEIARQNRPRIYDLQVQRPQPIISRDLRFEVPERTGYRGSIIMPLDEGRVTDIARVLVESGVESVAVCLLFSFTNPDHEIRVKHILEAKTGLPITVSSEVLPEFREYERTQTVAANAALRPVVGDYLERLDRATAELGLNKTWQIMQSNAGITSSSGAQSQPVRIVLSGPAAGVQGARITGAVAGYPDLITLDMGGTSCDVCLIKDGQAAVTTDGSVAGYPIKVPMVDIHTIGAGGGSIAWIDKGGALRVGPQSAGADPGPVCYGKGGLQPTVTDAHVVLGRLDPLSPVGDLDCLDAEAATAAIRTLIAGPLGMTVEDAAQGIIAVAEANMERAIRVISVARGHDPRRFALLPFGGAGPLHGAGLAFKLGMAAVLVPERAGVLSALGLLHTDLAHDYVHSVVEVAGQIDFDDLNTKWDRLRARGRDDLVRDGIAESDILFEASVDMRYAGQSFELNLETSGAALSPHALDRLIEGFHHRHEQVYGHAGPGEPVEIVNLRLKARGLVGKVEYGRNDGPAEEQPLKGLRRVHFAGLGWMPSEVFERARLPSGHCLKGPAVIESPESTVVVPPEWQGRVDGFGNLILSVRDTHRGSADNE